MSFILGLPDNLVSLLNIFLGNDIADEDVDIGGNEAPVSSYPPVVIEKDTGIKTSKCPSPGSSSGMTIFGCFLLYLIHQCLVFLFTCHQ